MSKRTQKRIVLAPQNRLSLVEHLAPRFFAEILGRDYADFLITDESELWDLDPDLPIQAVYGRMEEHYFISAGSIATTNIVALLELLCERGVTA